MGFDKTNARRRDGLSHVNGEEDKRWANNLRLWTDRNLKSPGDNVYGKREPFLCTIT